MEFVACFTLLFVVILVPLLINAAITHFTDKANLKAVRELRDPPFRNW